MAEMSSQREALVREMEEAAQRHAREMRDLQTRKDEATASLQVGLEVGVRDWGWGWGWGWTWVGSGVLSGWLL